MKSARDRKPILNGLPVEVSSGVPQGTAYVVDGNRTVAVVGQDGSV